MGSLARRPDFGDRALEDLLPAIRRAVREAGGPAERLRLLSALTLEIERLRLEAQSAEAAELYREAYRRVLEEERLLTAEELAQKLGVHKNTIFQRRDLPRYEIGRAVRYRLSEVLEYFRPRDPPGLRLGP